MKDVVNCQSIEIPKGVKVNVKCRVVEVEGPRGKLKRSFKHSNVNIKRHGNNIVIEKWFGTKKEIATIRTCCSHIQNMFKGVTEGFCYKMKAVYAHFPITVMMSSTKTDTVNVRNFLGEKHLREVKMMPGVEISNPSAANNELHLKGNDVEAVSRCAALVHQSALVRNKDIRKFLDGIYVSSKGPVVES
ncbi:hypothetical protein SNEBB_009734 [Seison nebaliae]|nr:hypothetical protein SNEBB_009734 [Seison nebaliae]